MPVADAQGDRRARFVVLGASNVALSIATIVSLARGSHDGPLEILTAHGRGRSFVGWSRAFFVRDLPGIGECGLWPVLAARDAPTTALVCDVGNDLVYGATPEAIAACVERDVTALEKAGARTVLMRLPMESLRTLGHARFHVIQRVIFPARKPHGRDALLASALRLDALMEEIARRHGALLVAPRGHWYGFDPIHILRAHRARAWTEVLAPLWSTTTSQSWTSSDRRELRRSRPLLRKMFGREEHAQQPSARFGDGSTLAWY
jgi:hypothetical protein